MNSYNSGRSRAGALLLPSQGIPVGIRDESSRQPIPGAPDPAIPSLGQEVGRLTPSARHFSWTDSRSTAQGSEGPCQGKRDGRQLCVLIPVSKFRTETKGIIKTASGSFPVFYDT